MKIEEVARLAGVSRSTASRVVNGDPRVKPATRARVQEVIRTHHYHPNAAARSLASRRTRIVGLLIPQPAGSIVSDPFFPRLIQGVAEACNAADQNVSLLMDTSEDRTAAERLYRRVVRGRHLDGVVVSSNVVDDPVVAQLKEDRFPCVLVGRDPRAKMSFVDVYDREAAQGAVAHLLAHGYRRIGMISGPDNMIASIDRAAGYLAAHQEAGIEPDPALTAQGDFTRRGGYRAMQTLLGHPP